jgi:hypothetical protein
MPDRTAPHGNFRLSDEAERPAPRVLGGGAHVSVWARTDAGGELVEKRALDADGRAALRAEADRMLQAGDGVVPALHSEDPDGGWLRMAQARGAPLHQWARGRSTPERRLALVALARAVAALHARGLQLGDLKPEHVRISPRLDGAMDVQIIDLGAGDQAGRCFGSPGFAAPERLGGAPLRPSADTYALGAIAWQVWTGAPPPVLWAAPPPDPRGPGLALSDAEVVLLWGLLAPDPSARPSAAAAAARWAAPGAAVAALPAAVGRALRRWSAETGPLYVGPAGSPLLPRVLVLAAAMAGWHGRALRVRWASQPELDVLEVILGPGGDRVCRLPVVDPTMAARARRALREGLDTAALVGPGLELGQQDLIGLLEGLVDLGAVEEGADGRLRWLGRGSAG